MLVSPLVLRARTIAETLDLDGIPVRTINLEGMLRTKHTSREKDVADRIVLERALETLKNNTRKP